METRLVRRVRSANVPTSYSLAKDRASARSNTCCKTVANMIKGKSPEEIRKTFNIQNDFTAEEEDQIRRENEWAEDR